MLTIRYALRGIRSAPLASGIVVLCIGLSVGATTTVFAWTDHLVRRPLPAVVDVDRVVSVTARNQGTEQGVSYPDYRDWRDRTQTLERLAAFGVRQFALRGSGDDNRSAEPVWGLVVSDNYFDVLGVRSAAGRTFAPGESRVAGEAPLAVISHRVWRQRFGADPGAIGQRLRLNGVLFTIIGVAPADFGGTYAGLSFDVWVPVTMYPALIGESGPLESRDVRWLQAIGRLRAGVTLAEARDELRSIGSAIARSYAEDAGRDAYVKPLDIGPAERLASLFTVLLGLTVLVTFIVCSNVANLLMLRGAARRYEIGVRLALGCGRGRIVGQMLCESVLLASAGAVVGLGVAWIGQQTLPALMPPTPLPLSLAASLEPRLFVFGLSVAGAMVPLFGLLPAIHAFKGAVLPSLRLARGGAGRGSARLRAGLVVAQLALSLTALVCAGLFLQSLQRISRIDRGFVTPERVTLITTDLIQGGFHSDLVRLAAVNRMLSSIRALPGVESASVATFVPLGFTGYSSVKVSVPGYQPGESESMVLLANRVADQYFDTMGIAMRRGRGFDSRDTADSESVVVVNEAFVDRFFAGREPVGRTIDAGFGPARVIGVAANGKYGFAALELPPPPFVYLPYARRSAATITVHVRTPGRPSGILPDLRRAIADVSPDLPISGVTTLDDYTSLPLFPVRLGTTILSTLGVVALLLAATGLYGVMAYRVAQRWRELAVRSALGAARGDLFALVFGDGVRQAVVGLIVGVLLSVAASRAMASALPQLTSPTPGVFAGAVGILLAIAFVAALLPALRASRVDPVVILRGE